MSKAIQREGLLQRLEGMSEETRRRLEQRAIKNNILTTTVRRPKPGQIKITWGLDFLQKSKSENMYRIRDRAKVLLYSRIIITALEEAVEYDPYRLNNTPPPALWIDDGSYLLEIKTLAFELKRLNDMLEVKLQDAIQTKHAVINVSAHLNSFVHSYVDSLGKGAAALTIGTIAALLFYAGVGREVIDGIWGHLKVVK